MIDKPNYYAILPASVRYDKDLSSTAKLLYCEITSLCNEKGYCWATNKYFMELYSCSERTIQNLLKQLNNKNFIKIEFLDNNSKRKIFIIDTPEKNFGGGVKKISPPYEKNFTHNNKKNNKNEYKNIKGELFEYNWLEDSTRNEVE